jgi:UDP-2,3-diacylglucosamine hydrolase
MMSAASETARGSSENEARPAERDQPFRVGIIAGSGVLPCAVAEAAQQSGHRPFIVGLAGSADAAIERFAHAYVHIGQVGRLLSTLRREGCRKVVFVGGLRRPNVFKVKVDAGFFRYMPELLRLFKGGDDVVLRGVARFFEARGFEVLAVHEIAPRLLAPVGSFSKLQPGPQDLDDIALGFRVTHALVARNYVLAVEAAEGTDAMLRRCRDLNRWGFDSRKGVLVKRPKPGQDLRFDLPAIGPNTIELAAEAGLAGIAIEAGSVLVAGLEELVEKADKTGLFLYGAASGEKRER